MLPNRSLKLTSLKCSKFDWQHICCIWWTCLSSDNLMGINCTHSLANRLLYSNEAGITEMLQILLISNLNKKRSGLKSISDGRFYIIIPLSVINMICAWSWISLQPQKTSVLLFIHSFLFICLYVQFILIFMKY